ncbi:MAG: associated Golgi protein [Hyphomicrobiales bacterium]|nr:associated Golgi protein [Hyphomicrobiales bacterium]
MNGPQVSLHGDQSPPATAASSGGWVYAPWLAVLATIVIIAGAWAILPLQDWIHAFSRWVTGLGPAGALAFGLAYILATLLLVPGAPMTIAGGIAFGWWGAPLVLVAATIGATLAFLVGRFCLRARLRRLIGARPATRAVMEAVDEEGWVALTLLRLSPVIPFNVQNYLLGATQVAIPTFFVSTLFGMIPGTMLSIFIGIAGRAASNGETSALQWTFLALGLAATIAVVVLITRKARQKLDDNERGDRV